MSFDKLYKDKNGFIYYWYGASMLLLKDLKSEIHKHFPIEIYIGLDADFEINFGDGWSKCRAVVIDSNQPHQLVGGRGCVAFFLLDPIICNLNKVQSDIFSDRKYYVPDRDTVFSLIERINEFKLYPRVTNDAKNLTDEVVFTFFNYRSCNKEMDSRIEKVLNVLDDIPEKKTSSLELAQLVNLSESRLAHLFKSETGTPIRRYLLWLRLRKAIKIILRGQSFTTAAHESGFSDSAHLSRTYRQMFGISPSDLLKPYQAIEIFLNN